MMWIKTDALHDEFDEIFDQVENGETFSITRSHGTNEYDPVAVLIPYDEYCRLTEAVLNLDVFASSY